MPRLKKKEEPVASPTDAAVTLTAGRSRRTIKPNRKYLNDSVVLATASKNSSRSSSPDSDVSADVFHQEDDEEEAPKPSSGRRSIAAGRLQTPAPKPRGRPRKDGIVKRSAKTEPIKNFRKEVMKKMDLTTLSIGKPRVVLTPINKLDIKRKLDLDQSTEKVKALNKQKPSPPEKNSKQEEKQKLEARPLRKRQQESPAGPDKSETLKKVINPVAVKKHQVEKTILVNRSRKEPVNSSDESDDEVQIVGISRESDPVLGRKSVRKSPLVTKQISPANLKAIRALNTSKATPPSSINKRKLEETEEEKSFKGAKKRHPLKAAKLSITADSEDEEDEEEEDEPMRRSTRSSLPSDKSSAASTPQNTSAAKAKESPASAGMRSGKGSELSKSNLSRTVSMPALDRSKTIIRPAVAKLPTQALGPKSSVMLKTSAQSTPKSALGLLAEKKSKSEVNLVDPICSPETGSKVSDKGKLKNATIRIVDIGDIIKNKSSSTPDVRKTGLVSRKSLPKESDDSEDSDESPFTGKPKTNNQLVASILERKRPINLDHLRLNRTAKRGRPAMGGTKHQPAMDKATPKVRSSVINLAEEDEIDFEDMLQTNIVTANTVQKGTIQKVIPGRHRSSHLVDENVKGGSGNKAPIIKTTITSNNNNVYKSNNNGRFGSTSPQKNPPRILNSTMKLGDGRPFAKLVANSGDKHYSIDLTDPDNDVKLIASPGSPTLSPLKRSPAKVVPRPIVTSGGLRNASNALNKPVGGAVQRSVSSLTSSSSPKMKKITCYETWYVINIPNNENKPERPSFAMSMIGLGNIAAHVQLPSTEWSHKIILTKRKVSPADGEEVFNGDVEDRAISEDEKRNYEPCNIMFRRKTAIPGKFNLQYDRAVIFKNDTFFINVDGKNCQLVGAPSKLDDTEDIETLLAVVDFVNLKNNCVELSTA